MTLFLFERITVVEASRRRVHKHTTIQPSTPDSDSLRNASEHSQQHQKPYRTAPPSLKVPLFAYELIPAIVLLIIPFSVHAGVFSSFMDIFADEAEAEVSLEAPDYAPHTTPLLNASKNPDPLRAVGGGDVFYDEAGVLVSTGPIGADEIGQFSRSTGQISVYTVPENTETPVTLSHIADLFGVTVNTIKWANNLESNTIRPGDTLVILPIVGVQHIVESGESLSEIVKEYDADIEEVLDYNNLASADAISVGDELMIPGGQMHTATIKSAPTPTKTSGLASAIAGFSHPAPDAVCSQGVHGYNGVDIASLSPVSILASAPGEVLVAKNNGWNGGYGTYVVIKHENTQTLYAHMQIDSLTVSVGDFVGTGQVIGTMGNTGKSSGRHLHFEVRGGTNPFCQGM